MAIPRKPLPDESQGLRPPVPPARSTVRRVEEDSGRPDGPISTKSNADANELAPSLSALRLSQEIDAAFGSDHTPSPPGFTSHDHGDRHIVPRLSLDKPLPKTPDDATVSKNVSRSEQMPGPKNQANFQPSPSGKHAIEHPRVPRHPPVDLPLGLRNTEDNTFHSRQAPAVVHETVEQPVHEVKHQVHVRDVHEHEVYHRILPVQEVEVRPARHFIEDAHGLRHEISPDSIPGRAPTNVDRLLRENVKQAVPADGRLPGQSGFTAREFAGTEGDSREMIDAEGVVRTEQCARRLPCTWRNESRRNSHTLQPSKALIRNLRPFICSEKHSQGLQGLYSALSASFVYHDGKTAAARRRSDVKHYSNGTPVPRPTERRQRASPTLVALGSNVGDRLACIEDACRALDADPDIRVTKTSALYETEAMYVEDQAPFLNGVCEIETSLGPLQLLETTQAIENQLGRVKTIDKGPRNIDLDILLHGDTVMETERLTIPHQLMLERQFVLRPMSDVVYMKTLQHPKTSKTYAHHLQLLERSESPMFSVTTLGNGCPELRPGDARQGTIVMSILNVTPDSFSDGGENVTTDVERLKHTARAHIAGGAKIIDIGGQSSRPNASDITAEEEIARVLPAIQAIRSLPEAEGVAISIDTYRAAVAEAAIDAGAHIVNDISAGILDPEMLPTVARLGCTYIMMHMRGTPATMMSEENCRYEDLLATVSKELSGRVEAAMEAGVRRWRIILDPGIGFSKMAEQNAFLLKHHSTLKKMCPVGSTKESPLPWLVGASRKAFIGKFTGVKNPKDRIWGTAATVVAAISGGADIVRVHDVEEMANVAKMADAIYRSDLTVSGDGADRD